MKKQFLQTYPTFFKLSALTVILTISLLSSELKLSAQVTESSQIAALPVKTVTVEIEDTYQSLRTFTGRAVAGRTSALAFELGGTITKITADLGNTIKAGEIIAELDTARLEASKAELIAQREETAASLKLAERTLKRAKETFNNGHASAQRLDEAEANAISLKARLKRLEASLLTLEVDINRAKIKAPFTGIITQRFLDEGVVASAGSPVLEITENSRMEAHIGMPPKHAKNLIAGEKAELRDSAEKLIEGAKVRSIVPLISGQTRTMMVTFDLPKGSITRGELITATIEETQKAMGTWLPIRALSSDVRGLWRVYKLHEENGEKRVRFENVQILYSQGNKAFVTGTISNGDILVADGMNRLAPRQLVRTVNQ